MCGIAGWATTKTLDEAILRRMTDTLVHRGPDAEGFYINPERQVGLGFRRLSIIDLAGGNQPMSNEDGTVWVIFNGEIYNYAELRTRLEQKGHRFTTNSDTEVIVHGYEEFGAECVKQFNGMFALAVYDRRNERLFLARDRFGKKPLHYTIVGEEFLFGSEIKALLAHPAVGRDLDLQSLARYLTHEYVPSPQSIFRGIKKVPPAHRLIYDLRSRRAEVSRYWDLKFQVQETRDEHEASAELLQRLREAVRCRLMSDVPLGVFLSGGIDSSAVVALMTELMPPHQVKTFNIAFAEKSFDESQYARQVAKRFGTDHHEQLFDVRQMLAALPDVMQTLDEPFADASLLPTFMLSRFTRSRITVALGGDGGDELFAGYPTFYASQVAQRYQRLPRFVQAAVKQFARRLPTSTKNFSFDFKVRQFLKGMPYEEPRRTQIWLGAFSPPELNDLFSADAKARLNGFDALGEASPSADAEGWLNSLIYEYVNSYLTDDILTKVDRASMACSLEVRAPFLDYTFAEFVGTLPPSFKLRGRTGKYLLKKSFEGRLPDEILYRPKKGFGIPIAQWLKEDLGALVREKLSPERLRKQGLFNPERVQLLLNEHQAGIRNHRKPLWTLLVFELWAERFGL